MEISTWIAFGGLLFMVVSALLAFAYKLGELNNRVNGHGHRLKALEDGEDGEGSKRESLALQLKGIETKLDIELAHVVEDLSRLSRGLECLQRSFGNLTSGRTHIRGLPEKD